MWGKCEISCSSSGVGIVVVLLIISQLVFVLFVSNVFGVIKQNCLLVNVVRIFVVVFVGVVMIVVFVIWEMNCLVSVDLLCLWGVIIVVMLGGILCKCDKIVVCFGCGLLVVGCQCLWKG